MERTVKKIAFNLLIYSVVTICLLKQYTEGIEFNFAIYNFFGFVLLRTIIYLLWAE
jgi:hypothetical protein